MKTQVLLIAFIVTVSCLFQSADAQCYASMSCTDDKTGVHYGDGDKWNPEPCVDCSCSVSKNLVKTCHSWFMAWFNTEWIITAEQSADVSANTLFPCAVVSESVAKTLPEKSIVRFYETSEFMSCCSSLFTPVGVHESCQANLIEGKCEYEVVSIATGETCEFPWGMVGKK